ncbi:MAG: NAD-dependent epimerase, partial [Lentisphaerae bacterium]
PRAAAVYNIGGSRHSNCSVLEAIEICERISGCKGKWRYSDQPRRGDHIWWISDIRRFRRDYPQWNYRYDIEMIIADIVDELRRNGNTTCTGMPEPT